MKYKGFDIKVKYVKSFGDNGWYITNQMTRIGYFKHKVLAKDFIDLYLKIYE